MTPPRSGAKSLPCALTIAGLDPSSGAGIAADLRAFLTARAWGCAVCAVTTVQSTAGLLSAVALDANLVAQQIELVMRDQRIRAVKTGALGSAANVRMVHKILAPSRVPLVVDPVMIATRSPSGAKLLDADALDAMRALVSVAAVITPNLDEACALLGRSIDHEDQMADAAAELLDLGPRAVVLKGGHLASRRAIDVLAMRSKTRVLSSPRYDVPEFHGGGCTMAALIAGWLATHPRPKSDLSLIDAVLFAKRTLSKAIRKPVNIGRGLSVLQVVPQSS